jgi:N6-adenosine-specific RNA methylase IME4
MKYRTIVADPPWPQNAGPGFDGRAHDTKVKRNVGTRTNSRTRPLAYSTMTVDEITALGVEAVADDDAHLYLWVTNKYIEAGYLIARAWGFKPVTLLTWCKKPMGLGMGGAFVQTTEHVLFCRRGAEIRSQRVDTTWWQWQRPYENGSPAHSVKPDAFLDVVEQASPGPYLELFARRARFGWDYWGDESLGTAEMVA